MEHSSAPELWEQAVAACLTTLCLTLTARNKRPSVTTMIDRYFELPTETTPATFRSRVGLCALDLADHTHYAPLITEITRQAIASEDAYVAKDVLTHHVCARGMSENTRRALNHIISTAALHHETEIPIELLHELLEAVAASETSLDRELATSMNRKRR